MPGPNLPCQGPYLPGPNFPHKEPNLAHKWPNFPQHKKVWAQFDAKSARGPICQGPICLEPSIGNGGPEPPTIYIFGILSAYKDSVGTNPIKISLRFFAEGKIFQTFHFSLSFHAMAEKSISKCLCFRPLYLYCNLFKNDIDYFQHWET